MNVYLLKLKENIISAMAVSKTFKYKLLKFLLISLTFAVIIFFTTSCDETVFDIYTQIKADYSGTRAVDIAVKTQYLKKGEVILSGNEYLNDKILSSLPKGKVETYDKEGYTHFKSAQEFDDVNFLQHISIDNFAETPPKLFYAKMETENYFFYSNYFFKDYIDMKIDDALIEAQGNTGDLTRISGLFNADPELLKITYQVKFPVKITKSNADLTGDGNIAIWNLEFGQQKEVFIEGKRIKYLSYILVVVLGLIGIFIIFLLFVLLFSRRRRRVTKSRKPYYSYDNYFKRDKYFTPLDDRDKE